MFGVTIVYRESKFSKPERGELRERERERDVPYLVLPLSTERANSLNQIEVSRERERERGKREMFRVWCYHCLQREQIL